MEGSEYVMKKVCRVNLGLVLFVFEMFCSHTPGSVCQHSLDCSVAFCASSMFRMDIRPGHSCFYRRLDEDILSLQRSWAAAIVVIELVACLVRAPGQVRAMGCWH